jgi:hypothetical protein
MSASSASPDPPPKIRQSSPRSRLGRVALDAAKGLPQVAGGVAGAQKLWATEDEGEILAGVVVAATRDGRFDVELHLIARWPFGSLFDLADQVRERVSRAASAADLEAVLGKVSVSFEDVADPSDEGQLAAGVASEQPR